MRNQSIQIFVIFAAVLIGLAYYTTIRQPNRKVQSTATIQKSSNAKVSASRNQLAREERRAERLRAALAQVSAQQATADSSQSQIQTITSRLQEIKNQLDDANQEQANIKSDEQSFYRDQRLNQNATKIILQNQLAQIETNLIALKARVPAAVPDGGIASDLPVDQTPGAPVDAPLPTSNAAAINANANANTASDIATLEAQKVQLLNQLQNTDLQADNVALTAGQQSQNLQSEVQLEQQSLRREYNDLQANLAYWQKQQTSVGNGPGDGKLREQRMEILQQELAEQDRDVSRLRANVQKQ